MKIEHDEVTLELETDGQGCLGIGVFAVPGAVPVVWLSKEESQRVVEFLAGLGFLVV